MAALPIKFCFQKKLRILNLFFVEFLPNIPKRICIQRFGIRIAVDITACLQIISQKFVLSPCRLIGQGFILINQLIQLLTYPDTFLFSIREETGSLIRVDLHRRKNPLLIHVIQTITRRVQDILGGTLFAQKLVKKHLFFSGRLRHCLKMWDNILKMLRILLLKPQCQV